MSNVDQGGARSARCDGNHGEPPCGDPECWLLSGLGDERITLPFGANCAGCDFSRLTPPDIHLTRSRICKRFPPAVIVVPTPGVGSGFALATANRTVQDGDFCYEYQERDGPEIEPVTLIGSDG